MSVTATGGSGLGCVPWDACSFSCVELASVPAEFKQHSETRVSVILCRNWVLEESGAHQSQSLEGLEQQQKALVWLPMPYLYLLVFLLPLLSTAGRDPCSKHFSAVVS